MKRAIVIALSWAGALALSLGYLAIGGGVDDALGGRAWGSWWIALAGVAASAGAAWLASAIGGREMARLEPKARHRLVAHVFALGPSERTRERAGRIVNSATDGVERVAAYKGTFLAPMIASLTVPLIVVLFVGAMIDPVSAGFLAIAIPLVPACVLGFRKAFKPVSARYRGASRALAAKELDAIQGLGALVLMNAGRPMGERLAEAAEEVRSKVMSYLAGNQLILLVIDSVFSLGMTTGAVALALIRTGSGAMSPGGALSLVLLSSIMLDPLDRIGQFFYIGMGGMAASREIKRFTSQEPVVVEAEGASAPAVLPEPGAVELSGVDFSYDGTTPVLRGTDLRIEPGEHVALAGPSGAGKSTVSAILQGFRRPDAGTARIDGVDLAGAPLDWVRARTGVVEQTTYLFSASLRENLLVAKPGATDAQLLSALRAAHLQDLLDRLPDGLGTMVGARGLALSGGEAQRVAIARAILKDASILILDEPTAHVDLASEREILAALRSAAADRTALVISHRDATIAGADRRVDLVEGAIR